MMISIEQYSPEKKEIWNSFLHAAKNNLFMFDRNYMEYHSDRFIDHSLHFSLDGELLALFPANKKDDVLYSHSGLSFGGFISTDRMKTAKMLMCFDALKAHMRAEGFRKLIYKAVPHIYHTIPAEEDRYALFRNNAIAVKVEPACVIDLHETIGLPKGRKANISRAKREGVIVRESMDIPAFMTLENEVLAKYHKASAVHTSAEMEMLRSRFPESIRLFVAEQSDEMIAGSLVFEYARIVHTQYLAANDKARKIGAMDYLISEMIAIFKKNKRYFDFGISTEEGGHVLNEGLMTQKELFGGRVVALETFELCVD